MDDFPAAHSMDTHWFGVDRDGRVALFETGETGGLPERLEGGGISLARVLQAAQAVVGSDLSPEQIEDGGLEEADPAELGLYGYRDDMGLYRRRSVPARPLRLHDLPQELREGMPTFALPEVSFAETPALQLDEHTHTITYGDPLWAVSEDGSMACARPGREAEFRAYFQTDADWVPLHEAQSRRPPPRTPGPRTVSPWALFALLLMLIATTLIWLWLAT